MLYGQFVDEVMTRSGLERRAQAERAIEHGEVVCQVLAEALPEATLTHVRNQLPEPLAELFTPRLHYAPPARPLHPPHPSGPDTSLSGGRPASYYPISEANPDRAQMN